LAYLHVVKLCVDALGQLDDVKWLTAVLVIVWCSLPDDHETVKELYAFHISWDHE
jgi:hypothetical protein